MSGQRGRRLPFARGLRHDAHDKPRFRIASESLLLRHFGLGHPRRLERLLLGLAGALVVGLVLAAAAWLRFAGELPWGGPRAHYFLYLLALLVLAVGLVRWPKVAGTLLALAVLEFAAGMTSPDLLPPARAEPQRFQWHPLLQAVPIPSLALTSATGLAIRHTREGTRGRDPEGSLDGRTVIATFGGSTTYDIGAGDGETWPDRLGQALGKGFYVVNHGVPGYTTSEHLVQTAFYQDKFGKPRCALYYVGWNDLRNAHIPNLDPAYADFHLPSQVDSQKVRRIGGAHVTISPLLTLLLRLVGPEVDTVHYFVDPYGKPPVDGRDPALEAIYRRNIAAISAINRQRGVRTIWVGQLLNRDRLAGEGRYGWLPLVRDRDLWPLQQSFNAILQREAAALGDTFIGLPPDSFTAADFVDQGHFSPQGARRFADALAPAVRADCHP